MRQYRYDKLEKNLQDLIAEEQAKLGYRREAIRLYYPLGSLCHLLGAPADLSADEMQAELEQFAGSAADKFGNVTISHKKERFCFFLPEEATEYVHAHRGENQFIYELVSLLAAHGTSMDDVIGLFERQSTPCEVRQIDNGEFDTLIRFVGGEDRYLYCFRDEMVHIIYHRFLPEDYADLYPDSEI